MTCLDSSTRPTHLFWLAVLAVTCLAGPAAGNAAGAQQSALLPSACVPNQFGAAAEFSMVVADFDGDGFEDALVNADGQLEVAFGSATGLEPVVALATLTGSSANATVGAFDTANGQQAVIARRVNINGNDSELLHVVGVDSMRNAIVGAPFALLAEHGAVLKAADIDGDGLTDLLAFREGGTPSVLAMLGDGAAQFSAPAPVPGLTQGLSRVTVADIDVDGDVDVVSGPDIDHIVVATNDGLGSFTTASISLAPSRLLVGGVTAADLDGDSLLDIIHVEEEIFGSWELVWRRQLAPGSFASPVPLAPVGGACGFCQNVIASDFNGDGLTDWSHVSSGVNFPGAATITVGIQGPAGQFSLDVVANATNMAPASLLDIDGDGDRDVVGWAQLNNVGPRFSCAINQTDEGFIGSPYCLDAVPNSSGARGILVVRGSASVADNDLQLTARDLPAGEFGFFLASRTQAITFPVLGSTGRLCLGGFIGRFNRAGEIVNSGPGRQISVAVDLADLPDPVGLQAIAPGDSLAFQAWHRDALTTPASNFTSAVEVLFQ